MKQDEFLLQIELKENEAGLYDYKVNEITIYRLLRRTIIENKICSMGKAVMKRKQGINKKESIKNTLLSTWQILKLSVLKHTASTVFVAFPRVDKVGDYYLDKFVDPLVTLCFDTSHSDFVILDQGRGGFHAHPRLNKKHCIQTDCVVVFSRLYARIFCGYFYKSHQECLDSFFKSVCSVFDLDANNKNVRKEIVFSLYVLLVQINFYKWLFIHLKCKRVIGPSRNFIRRFIVAAHLAGAKSYELQHGIVDGIRIDNSGFQPKECTPDNYLAFGEDGLEHHAIEIEKVVNIGWAFGDYISTVKGFVQYKREDVLVISDPLITDMIIDATLFLAKGNPQSHFYVRPHPHEEISEQQNKRLKTLPNVHWQDKRINIAIVMRGFTHVVGENSTVVYEALAAGKKVGRLCLGGLKPRNIKDDDCDCFWEIKDQESFIRFIREDVSTKKRRSIYSPFNKDLFMKTIGII